MAYLPLFNFIP